MLHYQDDAGALELPLPQLFGAHQAENAALAVAMLRHQTRVTVTPQAMAEGIRNARWPARLQALGQGPITAMLPDAEFILDGGHNPDAAQAIARVLAGRPKVNLVMAMMSNRPVDQFLQPLAPHVARLCAVPLAGHDGHSPDHIRAAAHALGIASVATAADVPQALEQLAGQIGREGDGGAQTVLIAGSLYLAGEVLRMNGEIPD